MHACIIQGLSERSIVRKSGIRKSFHYVAGRRLRPFLLCVSLELHSTEPLTQHRLSVFAVFFSLELVWVIKGVRDRT